MVHSSLVTRFATTTDYSSRNGARVDAIGHHHAASTSLEGTLLQFQPGGREVSPNYCIEGRNIVLVVPEEFRPWTSASSVDDARSITYEIINSSGDPDWRFSAATIESVVALDIDICRRYGITPKWGMPGLWQHKDLYIWFGRSYPTACAGPSFPKDHIVSTVSAGLAGTPPTPTGQESDEMLTIKTNGDQKARPPRNIGAGYECVLNDEEAANTPWRTIVGNDRQYDLWLNTAVRGKIYPSQEELAAIKAIPGGGTGGGEPAPTRFSITLTGESVAVD